MDSEDLPVSKSFVVALVLGLIAYVATSEFGELIWQAAAWIGLVIFLVVWTYGPAYLGEAPVAEEPSEDGVEDAAAE